MAKGFKHGAGGGASLNFDVKAYATVTELLAATPKENTIGIVTDVPITGYLFSATQPETITEGMVWISTGSASTAAFNALKKNSIMVYPTSVTQYVDGIFVGRTAKSYQSGAWVDWPSDLILVDANGVRGGYAKSGSANTTVTVNENDIEVKYAGGSGSTSAFSWADIDVTEYNLMEVSISGSGTAIKFSVGSAATTTVKTAGTYELDISQVSGPQTVGFNSTEASFTVTDWRLKR